MSGFSAVQLTIAFALLLPAAAHAQSRPEESCVYFDKKGNIIQAASIREVPAAFRSMARCAPRRVELAAPESIELSGNLRTENITSSIGPISLRWPRKVESLFGRTPLRAMTDAARTVSRALKSAAFPGRMQSLSLEWKVVFMDENMPVQQIPARLVDNCHPGWMTPPANIYIVADRVASGCSELKRNTSVADSTLTEVLLHELGHAVEFYLLEEKGEIDRMRAEGFATWFSEYAAQYSSILDGGALHKNHLTLAKTTLRNREFHFGGDAAGYARASMYFSTIEKARRLPGIVSVYRAMTSGSPNFFDAVEKALNWPRRRLEDETRKYIERG